MTAGDRLAELAPDDQVLVCEVVDRLHDGTLTREVLEAALVDTDSTRAALRALVRSLAECLAPGASS